MATWDLERTRAHILICNGSSCLRQQGEEVTVAIRKALKEKSLDDVIHTTRTRCNGRCKDAPTVIVYPEGTWYQQVFPEDAEVLVSAICKGEQLREKVSHAFSGSGFHRYNDAPIGIRKSENGKKPPDCLKSQHTNEEELYHE